MSQEEVYNYLKRRRTAATLGEISNSLGIGYRTIRKNITQLERLGLVTCINPECTMRKRIKRVIVTMESD